MADNVFSQIRCIVADMDGTLLNEEKELDEGIRDVVNQLQKKNILFTLASGRNVQIMKQFIDELGIKMPYIVNNGAGIYQENECLFEQIMDEYHLKRALCIYEEENISYIAYASDCVYVHGNSLPLEAFLKRLKGKTKIYDGFNGNEIAKHNIFKVVAINKDHARMSQTQTMIHSTCNLIQCIRSENDIYTITHKDVSKGNAIKFIMRNIGISLNEVLVFGDNFNDISMFEIAGTSVAMGNSDEFIKEKATYVTYSNKEQGVSKFIKKHIF